MLGYDGVSGETGGGGGGSSRGEKEAYVPLANPLQLELAGRFLVHLACGKLASTGQARVASAVKVVVLVVV